MLPELPNKLNRTAGRATLQPPLKYWRIELGRLLVRHLREQEPWVEGSQEPEEHRQSEVRETRAGWSPPRARRRPSAGPSSFAGIRCSGRQSAARRSRRRLG